VIGPFHSRDNAFHWRRVFFPIVNASVILLLCATIRAQEACDVEAKILLLPAESQLAVAKLKATGEASGHVYFFDTNRRELLSQGVIVRLRQGARSDLTVKLRRPEGKGLSESRSGRNNYKCEVDLTASGPARSYSIRKKYVGDRLPATGSEILGLLSPGQKKLLKEAQVSIDWARVERVEDIRSTTWQVKGRPGFEGLTLELWQWPAGNVLELSTRAQASAGSSAYAALRRLVERAGLSPSDVQELKTSVVLRLSIDSAAH
jgi:hypothetical protein